MVVWLWFDYWKDNREKQLGYSVSWTVSVDDSRSTNHFNLFESYPDTEQYFTTNYLLLRSFLFWGSVTFNSLLLFKQIAQFIIYSETLDLHFATVFDSFHFELDKPNISIKNFFFYLNKPLHLQHPSGKIPQFFFHKLDFQIWNTMWITMKCFLFRVWFAYLIRMPA